MNAVKTMFDLDTHMLSLTLAQDGAAPSMPGEPRTSSPGTANGLGGGDGEGGAPPSMFGGNLILIMFLVITVMIVMSILGQRRERKKREAMISAIKKHDKVQTIGGVIGSIVELKPDFVVLKVDESSNTRITFARSAVQQVIKSSDTPAEPAENL